MFNRDSIGVCRSGNELYQVHNGPAQLKKQDVCALKAKDSLERMQPSKQMAFKKIALPSIFHLPKEQTVEVGRAGQFIFYGIVSVSFSLFVKVPFQLFLLLAPLVAHANIFAFKAFQQVAKKFYEAVQLIILIPFQAFSIRFLSVKRKLSSFFSRLKERFYKGSQGFSQFFSGFSFKWRGEMQKRMKKQLQTVLHYLFYVVHLLISALEKLSSSLLPIKKIVSMAVKVLRKLIQQSSLFANKTWLACISLFKNIPPISFTRFLSVIVRGKAAFYVLGKWLKSSLAFLSAFDFQRVIKPLFQAKNILFALRKYALSAFSSYSKSLRNRLASLSQIQMPKISFTIPSFRAPKTFAKSVKTVLRFDRWVIYVAAIVQKPFIVLVKKGAEVFVFFRRKIRLPSFRFLKPFFQAAFFCLLVPCGVVFGTLQYCVAYLYVGFGKAWVQWKREWELYKLNK